MDDKFLQKRIRGTKNDIFPLDRLLPLESVYQIFKREYLKSEGKNIFFYNRKYQRLREGYFSMFIAISLQDISTLHEKYYLIFPSDPSNDIYICHRINNDEELVPKLNGYEFDIKEYTNYSENFEEFINKNIFPKINAYNIAIAVYRDINEQDGNLLINYLKTRNISKKIWILGLPQNIEEDYAISKVIIISKDGLIYNMTIYLEDWIDKNKTPMVFQDIVRFK